MARARKRQSVSLEGTEDLERAIKRLSEDVQGVHLRAAVEAGAEVTRNVASQLAPRSTLGSRGHSAGFLARNIRAERQFTRSQDTAVTDVGMTKEAWYGRFQETGTVYEPAQPFLRPALDETKNDVVDTIAEHLRNVILRGI